MIMSMKKFGFSPKRTSSSFIAHYPSPSRFALPPAPSRSLSDSVMIQILEVAEPVIVKWDPESSTSLFYDDRQEALEFIKLVSTLHKAMHSLVAENSSSNLLLDPEAVSTRSSQTSTRTSLSDFADESDDEVRVAGELISEVEDTVEAIMADLNRWQEIVSVFSYPSTSSVVNQVLNSLIKLAELVRSDLTEFKTLLNKESLKTTVADAGVHLFTVETMNCLSLLADYSVLPDILMDSPPPEKCVMPETFFDGSYSDSSPSPSVSAREFYNAQRVEMEKDRKFAGVVKYAPEDMGNALSDLFFGSGTVSGSVSSSTSSSSSKSRKSLSRYLMPLSSGILNTLVWIPRRNKEKVKPSDMELSSLTAIIGKLREIIP
ncbi:hypothetical protein L2E82_32532 [Cichorium intybus]|uniref:Uncharacterized protein n=1 Tax=Cichorium intybus TaxID=13427 RepID=A0ACB9BIM0_CICIN|nr:hypothetical protein L2E82_32532 [Cichorium intybus]